MSATLLADYEVQLRAKALIRDIPDPASPRVLLIADHRAPPPARRRRSLLPLQIGLGATVGLAIAGVVTFSVIGNVVAPEAGETAETIVEPVAVAPAAEPAAAAPDLRIIDPVNPPPVDVEAPVQTSAAMFGASGNGNDALAATPGVAMVGGEAMPMTPNGAAGQAVVVSAVNMRAGPNNRSAVLMVVPAGAPVALFGCDYWCQVSYAGQTGWIYQDFLALPR